jgi:hypothetical protein
MRASEAEIELQARVIALECVLKTCLIKLARLNSIVADRDNPFDHHQDSSPIGNMMALAKKIRTKLSKSSISGNDLVMSDHVTSLVQAHTERLFQELVEEMKENESLKLGKTG